MVKIGLKYDKSGRQLWYKGGVRVAGKDIPQTVRKAVRMGGELGSFDQCHKLLCSKENANKSKKEVYLSLHPDKGGSEEVYKAYVECAAKKWTSCAEMHPGKVPTATPYYSPPPPSAPPTPTTYCLYRSGDKTVEAACKSSKGTLQTAIIREILSLEQPYFEADMKVHKVDLKGMDYRGWWVEFPVFHGDFGTRVVLQKNARIPPQLRLLILFPDDNIDVDVQRFVQFAMKLDYAGKAMEMLGYPNYKHLSREQKTEYVNQFFPA